LPIRLNSPLENHLLGTFSRYRSVGWLPKAKGARGMAGLPVSDAEAGSLGAFRRCAKIFKIAVFPVIK